MSTKPLVSVVIPTYNRARYLGEAIESVLNQTVQGFEIIVVDDGSTDETRCVVARYEPAVRYVWQENSERGAARNRGLRLARGEFIAFLDSDDIWLPEKLERQLEALRRRPGAGVAYSDYLLIDAEGHPIRRIALRGHEGWVTEELLRKNFIPFSTNLIRAQPLRDAGGFREERELSPSEDWEMWVRLSIRVPFAFVREPTAGLRVHPGDSMQNAADMDRSQHIAYSVIAASSDLTPAQRRLLPRAQGMSALINAINYCSVGDFRRTWKNLVRAAHLSPVLLCDPRFPYTVVRSIFGPRVSDALKRFRSMGHRLTFRGSRTSPAAAGADDNLGRARAC